MRFSPDPSTDPSCFPFLLVLSSALPSQLVLAQFPQFTLAHLAPLPFSSSLFPLLAASLHYLATLNLPVHFCPCRQDFCCTHSPFLCCQNHLSDPLHPSLGTAETDSFMECGYQGEMSYMSLGEVGCLVRRNMGKCCKFASIINQMHLWACFGDALQHLELKLKLLAYSVPWAQ